MGLVIAAAVILLWAGHLLWSLYIFTFSWTSPMTYVHMVLQGYLYTGLFITAHDSMHGGITRNRKLNNAVGQIALALFAAFSYKRMFPAHMAHHRWSGTEQDPDFSVSHQGFFPWFFIFFFRYVTAVQLLIMAALFNIGVHLLQIPAVSMIAFWVIPAFLGTFQLFYFGTFRPHRYPHTPEMGPHKARTQKKNHLWAMVSCYFFGYHREHHELPRTPWWLLYRTKQQ
jgi:beta-carotene/zeaxanthin 4-ketolase